MDRLIERLEARTHLSTVTWDGEGGDFSWHNPLNWSGDVVPTLADDVVIDGPLAQPIVHSDPGAVSLMRSLSLNAPLEISGGLFRVEVTVDVHSTLSLTGGMLSGTANIHVHDRLEWSGGSIRGFGLMYVEPGGDVQITGNVILARGVFVDSTMHWAAGDLIMVGSDVQMRPGGIFEANSTGVVRPGALSNSLVNASVLRRTAEGRGIINVTLHNTGTVEVLAGALSLWGPVTQFAGGVITGGTWHIGERAVLATTSGPLTIIGPSATVILESRYRFGFPALAGLQLNEGTLQVVGRRHLNFLAPGFINGETGTIEKFGAGTHSISTHAMVNYGTIIVHSGILRFAGGADLRGLIDIRQDAEIQLTSATTLQQVSVFGAGQLRVMAMTTWVSGLYAEGGKALFVGGPGTLNVQPGAWSGDLARQLINLGTVVLESTGFNIERIDNFGRMRLDGAGTITRLVNHDELVLASSSVLTFWWLASDGRVEVLSGEVRVFGFWEMSGSLYRAGGSEVRLGGYLNDLTVTGAGTLRLNGADATNLTIDGGMVMAGHFDAFGKIRLGAVTFINEGNVRFWGVDWSPLGGAITIQNNGTWDFMAQGLPAMTPLDMRTPDLTFSNAGRLRVTGYDLMMLASSVPQVQGNELIGGEWHINGGLRLQGAEIHKNHASLILFGGSSFPAIDSLAANHGTIAMHNPGGPTTFTPAGGTFTNHGLIIMHPSRELVILGDLALSATSFVRVHIAGPSTFARIVVSGNTTVGGTLQGYFGIQHTPGPGEFYEFLSTQGVTGAFASVTSFGLPLGRGLQFEVSPSGGRMIVI